ncbi:MAG: glutamine synthetase [Paracoccaceae bacterium]|jgi:glutamine synthetase
MKAANVRLLVADLNGQARGKRIVGKAAQTALINGSKLPKSALNLDIRGDDIESTRSVFATGDADGQLRPTGRGPLPCPWLDSDAILQPCWMFEPAGDIFEGDPRHALNAVVSRLPGTAMVATEVEFFLLDLDGIRPPPAPIGGLSSPYADTLAMSRLDAFEPFFADVQTGAEAMGLELETFTAEAAPGQFEITLSPQEAMRAADDCWLTKLLIQGMARKHGFAASFAAKPYVDHSGSGLHMHCSMLGSDGQNLFDSRNPNGTEALHHAIGGCLAALPASMLIFAPHALSYARLAPGAHAPTGVTWGNDNRTVALRIPASGPAARRLEHRVAGGDANPYLMIAVILGAMHLGLSQSVDPGDATKGNAYDQDAPQLPTTWPEALQNFVDSTLIPQIFSPKLIANFLAMKRQDQRLTSEMDEAALRLLYLDKT